MPRRSSIASVVMFGLALAVLSAGGILGYNRFVKAQLPNPETPTEKPAPADKYDAFKKILPGLQKELSTGEWKEVRLDDMKITATGEAVTIEFRGVWLYEGAAPKEDIVRALHTVLKTRSQALLKEQIKDDDLKKTIEKVGYEERGIDPVKSPLPALRTEVARRKELLGAVLLSASYGEDGRLHLGGYTTKDHDADQKKLIATLFRDPAITPATVVGMRAGELLPLIVDLMPADYAALKTRLQTDLATAPEHSPLRRTRLDEVGFVYVEPLPGAPNAAAGPALVLRVRGVFLANPGDDKDPDPIRAQIAAAVNKGPEEALPKPVPDKFTIDVREIVFKDNPIFGLQEKAVADPRLSGVLFQEARYDKDGKLEIAFLTGEEQQPLAEQLLKGLTLPATPKAVLIEGKAGTAGVVRGLQAKLAADPIDEMARMTRLDRAYFAYAGSPPTAVLNFQGVCLKKGDVADLRKALQKDLEQLLKTDHPTIGRAATASADKIEFKEFPLKELQSAAAKDPALDGVLFLKVRYDSAGMLRPEGFIPEGADARKRIETLLQEKLKGTGIIAPAPAKPASSGGEEEEEQDKPAAGFSLDDLKPVNWQAALKDLRKQLSSDRKEPLFRQTRVDRAYFEYVGDEPRIHVDLIALQPHGDKAQLRSKLEQRLEAFFPSLVKQPGGMPFKVTLPDGPFITDPTPALQRMAAEDAKLDGVLFESVWFDENRKLNFDVIYDDAAGQAEKLKTLIDQNKKAAPLKPALRADVTDEPILNSRNFHWEEHRQALQGELAASRDPLQERTRIDRLYFTYVGDDTADRRLEVKGICLQAGAADDNRKKLAEAIQARWKPHFPGTAFQTHADGVSFLPSPIIGLQSLAVAAHLDDALFESAVFDRTGKVHLRVALADPRLELKIVELVAKPAAREVVRPVLGTRAGQEVEVVEFRPFVFRTEGRAGLMERLQTQFAGSTVRAAQQTRLDRVYFLYDPKEVRQLHIEGVSLWDGLPKATLPEALLPVCRDLLPEPTYQVVSDRVARKPNPAPTLQEKVEKKPEFDGLLFEDVVFDARGRLVFSVLLHDTAAQRTAVGRLLAAPPLAEGVLPLDPARRELMIVLRPFDWNDMMKLIRAWAAGATASHDARQTRIDRAYFTREDGGCQLQLAGATLISAPEGDPAAATAVRARITTAFGPQFLKQLRPLNLKLPEGPRPLARGVLLSKRDLRTVLRRVIPALRVLDGVNITDVVYDEAGKVALEGHWVSTSQGADLGPLLKEALQPEWPAISRFGTTFDRMRIVRTDLLLRDLRQLLIDKTDVEEVLLDRLYFDAEGKLRIDGFYTRPDDRAPADKTVIDGLLTYPIGRALLGLDPEGVAKPSVEGRDIIHLVERASLVRHLRREVPKVLSLDGIRIDRCFYDGAAVFVLNGLEDAKGQAAGLRELLDAAAKSPAYKDHLAGGWRLGQLRVVPLQGMLHCLNRIMPAESQFDRIVLERAYHDANNILVVIGSATFETSEEIPTNRELAFGKRHVERATNELKKRIENHHDWKIRLTYGGPAIEITMRPADPVLAERAYDRAARIYANERKAARALADLDTVLFNNPADVTTWYFRAVRNLALGDKPAAERDLRRVLEFAGRPPLIEKVLDYRRLELVQGRDRAGASRTATKFALELPEDKPLAALVKELCEGPAPVAPPIDEAPGWDTPFYTRMPCGVRCCLPR